MAYSAIDIAKKIVCKTDVLHGDTISNLKLQKLLYFMQGFHLAWFGAPLFGERMEAWTYGPVVPVVFQEFKRYKQRAINPERYSDSLVLSGEEQQLFDRVYSEYNRFSAVTLMNRRTSESSAELAQALPSEEEEDEVNMTHSEGPWKDHGIGDEITNEELRAFFLTLSFPTGGDSQVRSRQFDEQYMQHLISLSAPSWKGVTDADAWVHQLRSTTIMPSVLHSLCARYFV